MRLRCWFCARPVRRFWLRCPVCKSKQPAWYILVSAVALSAAGLVGLIIFHEFTH
jgi:hypothetical protein